MVTCDIFVTRKTKRGFFCGKKPEIVFGWDEFVTLIEHPHAEIRQTVGHHHIDGI